MDQVLAPCSSSAPTPRSPTPWRAAAMLALGLLAARLVYLAFLCPFELVGDEAQYWDWSRRPALSYYTKGPGIAWTIRLGVLAFGNSEFAVRFFAPVAAMAAGLATAGLAMDMARRGRVGPCDPATTRATQARAAFYAVALFSLTSGYQVSALLMTIDGPYIACWALAAWAGWRVVERWARGQGASGPALAFGAILGVGFLYKYTILLFLPGYLVFLWRFRPGRGWREAGDQAKTTPPPMARDVLLALAAMLACMSPVLIWNHLEGWPTVRHLLGHLGVKGGDLPPSTRRYTPLWTLGYLAQEIGVLGLAIAWLLATVGVRWKKGDIGAIRDASGAVSNAKTVQKSIEDAAHDGNKAPSSASGKGARDLLETRADPFADPAQAYLLSIAAPMFLFYLVVSFFTDVEANWPMAGFVTLLALLAWRLAELDPGDQGATTPSPTDAQPHANSRPAFPALAWRVAVVYGVVTGLGMLALPLAARLPKLDRLMARASGHRALAEQADAAAAMIRVKDGREPAVLAARYEITAWLGFYMKGRPAVRCASTRFGNRQTPYDYFADTRLDDSGLAALRGHPLLLVGNAESWKKALDLERVEPLVPPPGMAWETQFTLAYLAPPVPLPWSLKGSFYQPRAKPWVHEGGGLPSRGVGPKCACFVRSQGAATRDRRHPEPRASPWAHRRSLSGSKAREPVAALLERTPKEAP